jgi:hypothetical protein
MQTSFAKSLGDALRTTEIHTLYYRQRPEGECGINCEKELVD